MARRLRFLLYLLERHRTILILLFLFFCFAWMKIKWVDYYHSTVLPYLQFVCMMPVFTLIIKLQPSQQLSRGIIIKALCFGFYYWYTHNIIIRPTVKRTHTWYIHTGTINKATRHNKREGNKGREKKIATPYWFLHNTSSELTYTVERGKSKRTINDDNENYKEATGWQRERERES